MTGNCPDNPLHLPVVMVVHGPEIFDSGDAAWLADCLVPARTIVAGAMARTAAEESGLPVEFDSRPPSAVIRGAGPRAFLANRGKTPYSGRVFGGIVASWVPGGIVHAECSDGRVYCWKGGDPVLAAEIAARTGFVVETAENVQAPRPPVREIRGCIPGEPVYINGIVVGRATAGTVVLRQEQGAIVPVSGLDVKPHGLKKLRSAGCPDIVSAWCKSGYIRRSGARPGPRGTGYGRIVVIDHCGHAIYSRIPADCCGVVAIGDDTTAVCGHICLHLGIPVLGITDNDGDAVVQSAFAPGSVVLDTRPERDDDAGAAIAAMVPDGPASWDAFVQAVLERTGGRTAVVLDLRETLA